MPVIEAVSGQGFQNNGATILQAGAHDGSNITNDLTLANNAHHPEYGSRVQEAVSPVSSGNIGTLSALSAGVFGQMEAGQYVGKIIGTRIAQTDDTFLRSGAAETASRTSLHYGRGYRRLDITDWSYTTGAATKGGSEGALVQYTDPADGSTIAHEARPTDAVPGELVYMVTGLTATQDDYAARTNP